MIDWLLDSDPAIRWQVLADLTDASARLVKAERAKVSSEGWGARLLSLQAPDGRWAGGTYMPGDFSWDDQVRDEDGRLPGQPWSATAWSLTLLRWFGLTPDTPEAQRAVSRIDESVLWEYDDLPFFAGEVEPCINGTTVANGAYFGLDMSPLVERLLGEQMEDGGWNCEQENGSKRGSFHTTIAVLEGLFEYQNAGGQVNVAEARRAGGAYLLDRRLFRSLSTGEVIDERWTEFAFPPWWHYDVLRGLDYLHRAGVPYDERAAEAVSMVRSKRNDDGKWLRDTIHRGEVHFEIDAPEGEPSRWNTLRAARVLKWAGRAD